MLPMESHCPPLKCCQVSEFFVSCDTYNRTAHPGQERYAMGDRGLHPEDAQRIRDYLDLSASETLPEDPVEILIKYAETLPRELLEPFSSLTTPRDRARVRAIKSRRIIYTQSTPTPDILSSASGGLRWPLLWERMGGSSLPPTAIPSGDGVSDEEKWVREQFQGGVGDEEGGEVRQHVKKLGGLLRGFEEEREMEHMRERKRMERRLDDVGEEFDSESDEEDGVGGRIGNAVIGARVIEDEDQESVARAFEKKLVELFVDGLDVSTSVSFDTPSFTSPEMRIEGQG